MTNRLLWSVDSLRLALLTKYTSAVMRKTFLVLQPPAGQTFRAATHSHKVSPRGSREVVWGAKAYNSWALLYSGTFNKEKGLKRVSAWIEFKQLTAAPSWQELLCNREQVKQTASSVIRAAVHWLKGHWLLVFWFDSLWCECPSIHDQDAEALIAPRVPFSSSPLSLSTRKILRKERINYRERITLWGQ